MGSKEIHSHHAGHREHMGLLDLAAWVGDCMRERRHAAHMRLASDFELGHMRGERLGGHRRTEV